MSNGLAASTTQRGVITRILGNLITVWPLNVHQEKALVFQDVAPVSSQYLKVGDWIQMEVESGDVVVYREKIEPVLQTLVTIRGNVQVLSLIAMCSLVFTRSFEGWIAMHNYRRNSARLCFLRL